MSADKRCGPVLLSGEGYLDCNNIVDMPLKEEMDIACYDVMDAKLNPQKKAEAIWQYIIDKNEVATSATKTGNSTYYWNLVPVPSGDYVSNTYTSVSPLLSTQWGQYSPWFDKSPLVSANAYGIPIYNAATGCVAVAMAQILYYLKMSAGEPIPLFETVNIASTTYSSDNLYATVTLSRSDYSTNSSHWSSMSTYAGQNINVYISNLMLDAGYRAQMTYGKETSLSSYTKMSSALLTCGVGNIQAAYNVATVLSELDNARPVILVAEDPSYEMEHAWITDGYNKTTTTRYKQYVWVFSDVIEPNALLSYTFEEMRSINPEVEEGDVVYYTDSSSSTITLHMNWGYDGNNDGNFNSLSSYWTYDVSDNVSYTFSSNPRMLYDICYDSGFDPYSYSVDE